MQTDIGVRIRKMREAQDLSPDDVCRMAGLTPDRLAAFEEGNEVPSIGVVIKLSRVLGSKVGGLLHGGGFASEELTVSRASETRPGIDQGVLQDLKQSHVSQGQFGGRAFPLRPGGDAGGLGGRNTRD